MSYKNKELQRAAGRKYYYRNRVGCIAKSRKWRLAHPLPSKRKSLAERFLRHVHINTLTGCWEWTSKRNKRGYGYFTVDSQSRRAHRVAYEIFVGEWPEGKQSDHLCVNASCVNPFHQEPVTQRENAIRKCVRRGERLRKLSS